MIQYVQEITVKEAARGLFELSYGPGGAWSRLFAQAPGFRGITLLRDTADADRYLAFESWDTAAHREQALRDHEEAYAALAAYLAEWTSAVTNLGAFQVRAEGTVRPQARSPGRRSRGG
jgi:heme-degrading monooxygenase HmoA